MHIKIIIQHKYIKSIMRYNFRGTDKMLTPETIHILNAITLIKILSFLCTNFLILISFWFNM